MAGGVNEGVHVVGTATVAPEGVVPEATDEAVLSGPAVEDVVARAPVESVIAEIAGECVVARIPVELVIAAAAHQEVYAVAAIELVVAGATVQDIVATAAVHPVHCDAADEHVEAVATFHDMNGRHLEHAFGKSVHGSHAVERDRAAAPFRKVDDNAGYRVRVFGVGHRRDIRFQVVPADLPSKIGEIDNVRAQLEVFDDVIAAGLQENEIVCLGIVAGQHLVFGGAFDLRHDR